MPEGGIVPMMLGLALSVCASAASTFDPAGLPLTGWWRNFSTTPWLGTTSAGTSGSGSNDLVVGNAPAVGTPLNGWGTADFNGSANGLNGEGTFDTFANASAVSFWMLVNLDSTASGKYLLRASTPFGVSTDGAGNVVMSLNNGGAVVSRAIATGAYVLVTGRYDGVNAQIGVNEVPGAAGGAATAAYSTPISSLASALGMGWDGFTGNMDGRAADAGITDIALSDAQFNSVRSYIAARYGIVV